VLNTQKQQVYLLFSVCLVCFALAIVGATLVKDGFTGALFTILGMLGLVAFLDVWLEPEKWKQKQC